MMSPMSTEALHLKIVFVTIGCLHTTMASGADLMASERVKARGEAERAPKKGCLYVAI